MATPKGFMLYHSDLHAIESLPGEDFKLVVLALLSLSENGERNAPQGAAGMAFTFMADKLARDMERYDAICLKNSEKGRKSAAKRDNSKPRSNSG